MKTVKIYNASDEFEAQMLISILEENHIPCYAMDSDIGENPSCWWNRDNDFLMDVWKFMLIREESTIDQL